jgi:hypothetical protein
MGAAPESTTTRTAGGLDFTAIGGKRQGREVPQSLKTTRWNRVRSNRFGKPNQKILYNFSKGDL